MTEIYIYRKFRRYGVLQAAIRVGHHIYLKYQSYEPQVGIISKSNENGTILFSIPHDCMKRHETIIQDRIHYLTRRCQIDVVNINPQMDMKDMCKILSNCGEILESNSNTGDGCEKWLTVTFKTEKAVEKAMKTVNGTIVCGNRIFVIDLVRKQMPNYKCTVLVKDLKPMVPLNTIYDFFIQYGPIEYMYKRSNLLVAFITFKSEESANASISCVVVPETLSNTGMISVEKSIGLTCK